VDGATEGTHDGADIDGAPLEKVLRVGALESCNLGLFVGS
jgi:hypothetical protein